MEKVVAETTCVFCGKMIFKKLAEPGERLWCLCPICIRDNVAIFKRNGGGLVVIKEPFTEPILQTAVL